MSQDIISARKPSSRGPLPSSFDENKEFYEEGWTSKLGRRLREEPLIPLGCLATCYALYGASRAMRQGKSYDVNRYFRARIYAQGFTLLCIVGGGWYYQDERVKRKAEEKRIADAKAAEMKDRWLKELELRDREDQEWRDRHEQVEKRAREAVEKLKGERSVAKEAEKSAKKVFKEGSETAKDVIEDGKEFTQSTTKEAQEEAKNVKEEGEKRGWLGVFGKK